MITSMGASGGCQWNKGCMWGHHKTDNMEMIVSMGACGMCQWNKGCMWGHKTDNKEKITSMGACGVLRSWVTKSVGSKEVKLKRRRWREELLEGLHMRAKVKIVRKGDGRYMEEQGNGSVACFSIIWRPVCMMLLVHCVFFAFSLSFLPKVRHSVYDKRLGYDQ